ncbi:sigma 54-interacting transcriptional regulator [Lignipirellula cremea]|uniref:Nitrogen fixation protein VnfA n=1 Tax=Lignipirellula cremea TaxID=2528010 RepID=A0A518DMW8_9BACT|nr:sigma 54-interacting transcriptional regulator [Lignipirellula cremea]QDU93187.1 Nitrogen fixation protein VnfA [Lignipirellula cremea]
MNAFLKTIKGPASGAKYPLDPQVQNQVGRGIECKVLLDDSLASRIHAVIFYEEDSWWVADKESRNGVFLGGVKIDEARLMHGNVIRFGSVEFEFNEVRDPADLPLLCESRTVVFDAPIDVNDSGRSYLQALQDADRTADFLDLYQLSLKLLACDSPGEVIRLAIELLHEHTGASVTGFLWFSDDGRLKPKLVIPEEEAGEVSLSESLTELVCNQRRACRLDALASDSSVSLEDFAEAICTPLLYQQKVLGAVHIYRRQGRFSESDFAFCVSAANILSAALARAQKDATLQADHQRLVAKSGSFDEMIGESEPMQILKSKIARVARASGSVLVRGESGAGKELVARALHKASPRADRPLLSVNCAAIPAELMESQLFGHKKGAFTSADSDHQGLFEQADAGTLFLDEVGEMTLEGQAKLLRILEGHPFLPVGGVKEITVDVRVIAATNRELSDFVKERKFREDLYYRLSVFELYIPPLRDRGSDIERLLNHFLEHFRHQHGRPSLSFSPAARQKLLACHWPGNVRQLRNVIDSAVVMAESDIIQPDDLPLRGDTELETLRLDYWEEKLIRQALSRHGATVQDAAKLLGIGRATLYRKIKEYEIEVS